MSRHVTLRPAPRHEPPYDDARTPGSTPFGPPLPLPGGPAGRRPGGRAGVRPPDPGVAHRAVHRFALLCCEVLEGRRPVRHLRACATDAGYADVAAELRATGGPVRLRTIRCGEPRPGAVEGAVVMERDGWVWAMSVRLERPAERWLCTYLRMI